MKRLFKKLWDTVATPFISVVVLIDESRRINEDGSWDTYWAKKNKRMEKRK